MKWADVVSRQSDPTNIQLDEHPFTEAMYAPVSGVTVDGQVTKRIIEWSPRQPKNFAERMQNRLGGLVFGAPLDEEGVAFANSVMTATDTYHRQHYSVDFGVPLRHSMLLRYGSRMLIFPFWHLDAELVAGQKVDPNWVQWPAHQYTYVQGGGGTLEMVGTARVPEASLRTVMGCFTVAALSFALQSKGLDRQSCPTGVVMHNTQTRIHRPPTRELVPGSKRLFFYDMIRVGADV